MPSFKDPALEQEKRDIAGEIDALEQEIEDAPDGTDTSDLEERLDDLEGQMHDVNQRRKDYRDQKRDEWKAARGKP